MERHRAHRRFPANGTAKYLLDHETGRCAFSVINFSREGIGLGITHDYSLRKSNSRELELRVKLLPGISPVKIAGTLQWVRVLTGDEDFAMTGGVKCKGILPIQLWRLIIDFYENDQHAIFNKLIESRSD
jgi:hypothetical protein